MNIFTAEGKHGIAKLFDPLKYTQHQIKISQNKVIEYIDSCKQLLEKTLAEVIKLLNYSIPSKFVLELISIVELEIFHASGSPSLIFV